jgi:alkanesulfonate monooxygenase SsuD/methylene tetrahydromethanopterin reductase-like flavin-dependent oxidoreductase (luciferase family)
MQIDIVLDSSLTSQQLTELGLMAEEYGIHTLWNASYLDGRDPFTNLAQLAQQSTRIKVAPMALNAYEMHPFRIAMALQTLNELAQGRVETMIGGGGEVVMALGIPFEKRVRYVRECLELVKGALHERPFTYKGELFSIENYNPKWTTQSPPFVYAGANRPQMLAMAAKAADGIQLTASTRPGLPRAYLPTATASIISWRGMSTTIWLKHGTKPNAGSDSAPCSANT